MQGESQSLGAFLRRPHKTVDAQVRRTAQAWEPHEPASTGSVILLREYGCSDPFGLLQFFVFSHTN